MLFTLKGEVYVQDELVEAKTAVKLSEGDFVNISSKDKEAQVLYIESIALNEEVAWAGPIVMNNNKQLQQAYDDLRNNNFVREKVDY